MTTFDLDGWVARSGALDLTGIDWTEVPRHPLPEPAIRTLLYMQDIESHTIVYLRSLLATRAIDDPEISTFLACWLYEETFHGIALARFLEAAGHAVPPRPKPHGHESFAQWLEARVTALLSRAWGNFCAVHMTWGAINELTTLVGYQRLSTVAGHPVLADILARIVKDEARHFHFYFRQGLRVTLNTDSRLVSATSVSREIGLAARAFHLNAYEIKRIIIMGFKSAFLPYAQKARLLREVNLEIDRLFMEEFPEEYDRRVAGL